MLTSPITNLSIGLLHLDELIPKFSDNKDTQVIEVIPHPVVSSITPLLWLDSSKQRDFIIKGKNLAKF